jgi:hypothetical protein
VSRVGDDHGHGFYSQLLHQGALSAHLGALYSGLRSMLLVVLEAKPMNVCAATNPESEILDTNAVVPANSVATSGVLLGELSAHSHNLDLATASSFCCA